MSLASWSVCSDAVLTQTWSNEVKLDQFFSFKPIHVPFVDTEEASFMTSASHQGELQMFELHFSGESVLKVNSVMHFFQGGCVNPFLKRQVVLSTLTFLMWLQVNCLHRFCLPVWKQTIGRGSEWSDAHWCVVYSFEIFFFYQQQFQRVLSHIVRVWSHLTDPRIWCLSVLAYRQTTI